jgi:hypothetical protein
MPTKHETLAQRSRRYANELKRGKNSITGETLNGNTASFRMGVLNERKNQTKIYNYKRNRRG